MTVCDAFLFSNRCEYSSIKCATRLHTGYFEVYVVFLSYIIHSKAMPFARFNGDGRVEQRKSMLFILVKLVMKRLTLCQLVKI